jgi:GcrA cell cycle regulator
VPVPNLAEIVPVQVCALVMRPPTVTAAPDPPPPPPQPSTAPTAFAARRTKSCCWPIGDPGTPAFRFCDQPAPTGKSYCTEHALVAYRPRARGTATVTADI